MNDKISPEFPYQSHYVEIDGHKLHYIEEGTGDPILFLHGNPTSSYLWRNVIPHVSPLGRCIAPDLIGMGKSDKPAIEYRFTDHYQYVEKFIDQMGLQNITLVIHDWGSALGFAYAMRNQNRIKGIAFMEAIIAPVHSWKEFPSAARLLFQLFRTKGIGWFLLGTLNFFIKKIMPMSIIRTLTPAEIAWYTAPYPTAKDRVPLWRWPNEIPIEGRPKDVLKIIEEYNKWLQKSECPKLLLYAKPGALTRKKAVAWCEENLKNLTSVYIGEGIHYIQEDQPHVIGEEIAKWIKGQSS